MSLLILGLGNDLLGDDGIGLLAAEALERCRLDGTEVMKSSLSGLYLIDLMEDFDDLIIIDSVFGDDPGKVVHLELSDVGPVPVPSAHYMGLAEAIELARRSGMRMPNRIEIIAMRIRASQVIGTKVGSEVMKGLPDLVQEVTRVAKDWGYDVKPESDTGVMSQN